MGVNLQIRNLKKEIVRILNSTPIPIEVKRMVVNEVLIEINQLTENQIQQELSELENERKENEDDLHSDRDTDEQ